jgi:hypothetical protein
MNVTLSLETLVLYRSDLTGDSQMFGKVVQTKPLRIQNIYGYTEEVSGKSIKRVAHPAEVKAFARGCRQVSSGRIDVPKWRIRIISASPGDWYLNRVGQEFDVFAWMTNGDLSGTPNVFLHYILTPLAARSIRKSRSFLPPILLVAMGDAVMVKESGELLKECRVLNKDSYHVGQQVQFRPLLWKENEPISGAIQGFKIVDRYNHFFADILETYPIPGRRHVEYFDSLSPVSTQLPKGESAVFQLVKDDYLVAFHREVSFDIWKIEETFQDEATKDEMVQVVRIFPHSVQPVKKACSIHSFVYAVVHGSGAIWQLAHDELVTSDTLKDLEDLLVALKIKDIPFEVGDYLASRYGGSKNIHYTIYKITGYRFYEVLHGKHQKPAFAFMTEYTDGKHIFEHQTGLYAHEYHIDSKGNLRVLNERHWNTPETENVLLKELSELKSRSTPPPSSAHADRTLSREPIEPLSVRYVNYDESKVAAEVAKINDMVKLQLGIDKLLTETFTEYQELYDHLQTGYVLHFAEPVLFDDRGEYKTFQSSFGYVYIVPEYGTKAMFFLSHGGSWIPYSSLTGDTRAFTRIISVSPVEPGDWSGRIPPGTKIMNDNRECKVILDTSAHVLLRRPIKRASERDIIVVPKNDLEALKFPLETEVDDSSQDPFLILAKSHDWTSLGVALFQSGVPMKSIKGKINEYVRMIQ